MPKSAPYGTWSSPITTDTLVESVVGLSHPLWDGPGLVWSESRPSEAGRVVPVGRTEEGTVSDLVPAGFSARTLVHEYGGACTAVHAGRLYFVNFSDQRIWTVPIGRSAGGPAPQGSPEPVTVESEGLGVRFADFRVHPGGGWLAAVRERHLGSGPAQVVNDLVGIALDGSGEMWVLAEGHDFFSAPRFSPTGGELAWLSWDHPNMPWDATTLLIAPTGAEGRLGPARRVAGGPEESVSQPRWSPGGELHFLSDRRGWWNLFADDDSGGRPVFTPDSEMGGPDWTFGQSSFTFLADGRPCVTWSSGGRTQLGVLEGTEARPLCPELTSFSGLTAHHHTVLAVAGAADRSPAVVTVDADTGSAHQIRPSRSDAIDPQYVSRPKLIEYPDRRGGRAFALYYRPRNPDFEGPPGERPPLVVMSHGGPTGQASSVLNPTIQYFTSRGLAVVDVDYGGSSGYGRAYRQRLRGAWGVVDVEDCADAATWLAERGEVDGNRLAIRGGSAGGYTTLAALAFADVFAVGASHYGVADAAALARDTHKFESRYLDGLIGPWPEAEQIYRERSPIHHTDGFDCPIILFQGQEDRVVPPDQAQMMADALDAKGIPHVLLLFEGEQHGFRQAETIRRVIAAELAFYGRVLGFRPADPAPDLVIRNEANLVNPGGSAGSSS